MVNGGAAFLRQVKVKNRSKTRLKLTILIAKILRFGPVLVVE